MKKKKPKNINYPEVKFRDVMFAFWRGMRPQKWTLFAIIISVVLASGIGTIIPILYKNFFDVISQPGSTSQIAETLKSIIFQILLLQITTWVLYRINQFSIVSFESNTIARLKQQSYDYLMDHSYSFFVNNFAGSLVQKVNRFSRSFEQLADRILWDILVLITKLVMIFSVLFFYNQLIAWIVLVWVAVFFVINFLFAVWKLDYDIAVAESDSKTTGYLADTITNQNNIQLFATKKAESEGFKKVTNEQAQKYALSWNLSNVMDMIQSGLNVGLQFALFFFAIVFWAKGAISIGIFAMIQSYIVTIMDNSWGFSRIIRNIYQSYADAKEMVEITLLPHEIEDIPQAKELQVDKGEIRFDNLLFSFNETRKVLENVNLIIQPGEKVALVGPSGAGKTTFVRLLLRLYSPTSGRILIDSQDIGKVTQDSLRNNISMVPQDPILFHRTLADNIAYGKPGASKQEIEKAAELAHCDEFIKDLPYGLETFVGERGIKLSGGERQRVAIARAILKNAPILVLDEATSSLDSRSEALIQDALNTLMKGKTVIVIAHRLSTIQKMDRIIVTDEGKIVEQGSHAQLLKNKNSFYKKLWTLQAGGFLMQNKDEDEDDEDTDNVSEEDESESKESPETKLTNF